MRLFPVALAAGLLALGATGCESDFTAPVERDARDLPEWRQMVSVGNSLTAGFMNGGIRMDGQVASFPNLVQQTILGREMALPLVDFPGIGSELGFTPLRVAPNGSIGRDVLTVSPVDLGLNLRFPRPYDNLGVPGTTTYGILEVETAADSLGNALFDLILRNTSGVFPVRTMIEQAAALEPDIMTVWSGNNEVLGGALGGNPQDVDPTAPAYIWPTGLFQERFLQLMDAVEAIGPEMVAVGNVPNVAIIPYVTYRTLGTLGFNRYHMEEDYDQDGDGNTDCVVNRPGGLLTDCNNVQFLLLTAPANSSNATRYLRNCDDSNGAQCDTIPSQFTLTFEEATYLSSRVAEYNTIIEAEVAARGWALVDANGALTALPTTPNSGPVNRAFPFDAVFTLTQRPNSGFTLDGVHPSEKGHAYMANLFLQAFNDTYGTSYPMYDVAQFTNEAGFEQYSGAAARRVDEGEGGAPAITEDARQALMALPGMLKGRF